MATGWDRPESANSLQGMLTQQFPTSTFGTESTNQTSTQGPSSSGGNQSSFNTTVRGPSSSRTTTNTNQTSVTSPSTSVTTQNQTRAGKTTTTDTQQINSVIQSLPDWELAQLRGLVQTLLSGGTDAQKRQLGQKEQAAEFIRSLFEQYTPRQAELSAREAVAYNLQKTLEENMPAIQRAIEGAGTSANAMQALLSQRLSTDASLAAGALAAEQQRAYAGTIASLAGSFADISKPEDFIMQDLLKAYDILKGAKVTENKTVTNTQIQDTLEQLFGLSTTANSGSTTTTTGTQTSNTQNSGETTTQTGTVNTNNWNSGSTNTTTGTNTRSGGTSGGGSLQQPFTFSNNNLIGNLTGNTGSSPGSSTFVGSWSPSNNYSGGSSISDLISGYFPKR